MNADKNNAGSDNDQQTGVDSNIDRVNRNNRNSSSNNNNYNIYDSNNSSNNNNYNIYDSINSSNNNNYNIYDSNNSSNSFGNNDNISYMNNNSINSSSNVNNNRVDNNYNNRRNNASYSNDGGIDQQYPHVSNINNALSSNCGNEISLAASNPRSNSVKRTATQSPSKNVPIVTFSTGNDAKGNNETNVVVSATELDGLDKALKFIADDDAPDSVDESVYFADKYVSVFLYFLHLMYYSPYVVQTVIDFACVCIAYLLMVQCFLLGCTFSRI